MASGGVTVKVHADVSGIEPAVRAEFDRIGAALRIGQVAVEELADALRGLVGDMYNDPEIVAADLLQQFVIVKRKQPDEEPETHADEP